MVMSADVGRLWPAHFILTFQHALDYWNYIQFPLSLLTKLNCQLIDTPNLIDYAFYAEIFANGYRAIRDEKKAREIANKAEEALQRISFHGFNKITAFAVLSLIYTHTHTHTHTHTLNTLNTHTLNTLNTCADVCMY
jgi:hypothetical protein